MPSQSRIGAASGNVMTVLGPIPSEHMGITLMHEHTLFDGSWRFHGRQSGTQSVDDAKLWQKEVRIDVLGELRMNPFLYPDNCNLNDQEIAINELMRLTDAGGRTVVDSTNLGIGRNPLALCEISRRTRLNLVMGSGYYVEASHPEEVKDMSVDDIAYEITYDCGAGGTQPDVCAGIIGEIGVGEEFSPNEIKVLRGAARASVITTVPLMIHLTGTKRYAEKILDIVQEEGACLQHTVLCHMNPTHWDIPYQLRLAKRGAFLEYDMIGMDLFFPPDFQCPSDEQNAIAITRLIDAGYLYSVLLSQDVFLKMMLSRYGGNGYAHILTHFVPRLRRHGVSAEAIDCLLVRNPRRVFDAAIQ